VLVIHGPRSSLCVKRKAKSEGTGVQKEKGRTGARFSPSNGNETTITSRDSWVKRLNSNCTFGLTFLLDRASEVLYNTSDSLAGRGAQKGQGSRLVDGSLLVLYSVHRPGGDCPDAGYYSCFAGSRTGSSAVCDELSGRMVSSSRSPSTQRHKNTFMTPNDPFTSVEMELLHLHSLDSYLCITP